MKVRGVQKEKLKKKRVLYVGKLFFFLIIFSLIIFLCTSKMIYRAWGSIPTTFLNHSKWSTYDEDNKQMLDHRQVIDDGLVYPSRYKWKLGSTKVVDKCIVQVTPSCTKWHTRPIRVLYFMENDFLFIFMGPREGMRNMLRGWFEIWFWLGLCEIWYLAWSL